MFILASPCLFCLSVSDHFVQLQRERGEGRNGAGHKWNVTESNWESFKSMAALPRSFLPSSGQLCCRLTWWPQSWSKGDICECRAWKVWLETSEALRFFSHKMAEATQANTILMLLNANASCITMGSCPRLQKSSLLRQNVLNTPNLLASMD